MSNSFWVHFLSEEITELNVLRNAREILPTDFTGFERFRRAIDDLFILIQSHTSTINRVQLLYEDDETNLLKNFFERIRALMYSQLPINYKTIIYNFYRTGLRIMYFKANMNYFDVTLDQCSGCNYEKTYCNCENTLQAFCKTNMQLSHIGIMETLAEDVVIELVYSIIENEVAVRVTDNFGDSLLPLLYHWLCNILFDWIKKILDPGCCPTYGQCKLNAILNKLKYSLYKSFTKIRFNQIYDIIIRFPYSEPAVDDLTVSLGNSDLNPELRILLQNNLKSKLLQPNMSTVDVLYVYTSAIRVLRKIDPSGILLAEVAQLIQDFLNIITHITLIVVIALDVQTYKL
ncbi:anaphase-promoting complex subunit 2-like [Sipha flava]|uniref:Anaphase-promoting complex subunit 2-like n=1 Tax=Sipha flava TaxID=143950 RepID=A0A8B8GA65_9HEMI|nr:anaphase-promoting complex subunit 2-like [Sipha flava]